MEIKYEELKLGNVYQTFFDRIFIVKKITKGFISCNRLYDCRKGGSRLLNLNISEIELHRHTIKYLGKEEELKITRPEIFI